jgi:hypothetical protein
VLFRALCTGIGHPKHSLNGRWPEGVSLIGHSAQCLGAGAPVRSILDGPGAHHGRLNVIAAKVKNVAVAIMTTEKGTGTERKLMWPYSTRPR